MKQAECFLIQIAFLSIIFCYTIAQGYNKTVVVPLKGRNAKAAEGIGTVTSQGRVWMDRNLGALRPATKLDDADAYGHLYQWGRLGDNHQYRTCAKTTSISTSPVPDHGQFITASIPEGNWLNPAMSDLWQGESGINNPCPAGFRIPTLAEFIIEQSSWSTADIAGAFASPLKLPAAGVRNATDGGFDLVGSGGFYWTSTTSGDQSQAIRIFDILTDFLASGRANGVSVRCIQD